ncbi:MAG TPA: aldo/keto reductase, partial [Ignavibacteriales bacterium]|nr:aldo/keto reductase [Ignavibacteriales bacterium]
RRDYIDIYQFHTWAAKFNVYGEWFEALSKLKDEGKIRAVGVSVPDTKPDSVIGSLVNGRVDAVQVVYNIFERYPEWNLFPVCKAHGIGVIARVPFDEGVLTGKYTEETKFPEGDVRNFYFRGNNLKQVVKRVREIKVFKNSCHPAMPMAEYALRFCLSADAVNTVIPGMRNAKQAGINTSVSDGKYLDKNELKELERFTWRKDFWFEEPKEA